MALHERNQAKGWDGAAGGRLPEQRPEYDADVDISALACASASKCLISLAMLRGSTNCDVLYDLHVLRQPLQ